MTATTVPPTTTPVRRTSPPIPMTRLVTVELRKMFDTRSGFWMLVSIGVLSVVAAGSVLVVAPDSDVTNVVLSQAADSETDLIVMGGYGHSRMREVVLGGMTRTILREMTVPVLMSH